MESGCLRHTELPHTSKLFADFVYAFEKVAPFYALPPHEFSSFEAAAAEIQYSSERRAALVSVLREQNGDGPSLELLSQPGTSAVVTGQQVGLFSGPAYTIYKALTAARLAHRLTEQGIPAVPVFWLATEDHDLAEISHCWVFDASHRPVRLEARVPDRSNSPVGQVSLTESPTGDLERVLGGFPYGDDVIGVVRDAYSPGRTFGSAFGELLKRLLSGYGLLYVDPLQPAVRELSAPMLRQALDAAAKLTRLVIERNKALEAAGYHAQVHVEPDGTLLFLLEGGGRLALRRRDGGYIAGDRSVSKEELADKAALLSPNALLRPVVQDYLLPTLASVVGPAELAYLAQSEVLYRSLIGRMPVVFHRGSFTLLDSRGERLMRRNGLALSDFFHGEEPLRERIATKLIPPVLARSLGDAASHTESEIERLHTELLSFDPTLAAALGTSRRKILYQLSKIERKVARESLRRNERAAQEASYLYGLLYPEKHLQERLYSIIPFLAKHGLDLIDRIYENVQLDCPDHRILVV